MVLSSLVSLSPDCDLLYGPGTPSFKKRQLRLETPTWQRKNDTYSALSKLLLEAKSAE
jgi:hypothetical protein